MGKSCRVQSPEERLDLRLVRSVADLVNGLARGQADGDDSVAAGREPLDDRAANPRPAACDDDDPHERPITTLR